MQRAVESEAILAPEHPVDDALGCLLPGTIGALTFVLLLAGFVGYIFFR